MLPILKQQTDLKHILFPQEINIYRRLHVTSLKIQKAIVTMEGRGHTSLTAGWI